MFDGDADSYLVTPFMSATPANQVKLEVSFSLRDCSAFHSNCKLFFGIYALPSAKLSTNPSPFKTTFNFVGDAKNTSVLDGYKLKAFDATFTIGMKQQNGIYLAFKDHGFCGHIFSISLSYFTCLTQLYGRMTGFPLTIAPNSTANVVVVKGDCLENAVNTKPGSLITLQCYASGHVYSDSECICKAGYEKNVRVCASKLIFV